MNSKGNFYAFLWHAILLSITVTFTEINTIMPALVLNVGGNEFHVGIMTAIMVGVPLAAQLFFAGFLHSRKRKKPYLLAGISLRVFSLALIAVTILNIQRFTLTLALALIYLELLLFTVSGAFAGISYLDILGKSFSGELRQRFFLRKQFISSIGILASALLARTILARFGYPTHYVILFSAAAAVLLLASGGFWVIREEGGIGGKAVSFFKTLRSIPGMLAADKNLGLYILVCNLLGYGTVLLPFYLALARRQYSLGGELVGNLLLLQISGMVIASLLWPRLVKKTGFKGILYYRAYLAMFLPLLALLISRFLPAWAYLPVFVLSGSAVSSQKLTSEAVLVELSTDENRALYSGIVGALNLTVALFPLVIGALIRWIGYVPVFAAGSALAFTGAFFIRRISCPIDRRNT